MPEEPLSTEQIIELGKKVGNQINAVPESQLFDTKRQQAIKDAAQLALTEILEPLDKRTVPEEDV